MEIFSGLINTPKSQSAEEIIPTLCDRLAHASLASDKRAAILTLKGFSREYRESVIANGLRGLINTLKTFTIDTEIVKACLETLLILFIRGEGDDDMTRSWISQQSRVQNGKYPSPLLMKEESNSIDQFSLWIADEVIQEDETISVILSLLENTDFYVRMYTLQLLEALVSMRPLRAKDAILHAPLGISSLIQVLGDSHDPVRNEAVLLLMAIANDNFNIQKLIAFENTFDRLFEIIHEEGDIRGSIVVQDCLSLIANLLKYNVSNQKLFLETNCLPKLAYLISEPLSGEEIIWNDQRLQNVIIALDIVKLFVLEGNESTKQNQDILFNADIFIHILRLSFSEFTPNSLRPIALLTTADLIDGNTDLQYKFSSIDVPYIDPSLPQQLQKHSGDVPVVIALLNWCLFVNSVHLFDIRVAAAHLIHAYFKNNKDAKVAFVQDQISVYNSSSHDEVPEQSVDGESKEITPASSNSEEPKTNGEVNGDGTAELNHAPKPNLKPAPVANLFQALLEYDPEIRLNPYKIWFSSVILLYLFEDDEDIKETVRKITTGDAEAGEEVLTSIQAISDVLVTTLTSQDPRISIGYLMLLIVFLYEDFDAVNDLLSELSTIKALMSYLKQPAADSSIVQGLVAVFLGVTYEFSSKDSPISRVDLHSLIVKIIGKDNYSLKVRQFKENEYFAEFSEESIYNPKRDESGLPEVFFDPILVSLIKENFNRIKNTLNKDPTLESNGRISYEKFEELQDTYHGLKRTYEELQSKSKTTEEELKTSLQKAEEELTRSTQSFEETTKELSELQNKHSTITEELQAINKEFTDLKQSHTKLSEVSSKQKRDLQDYGVQSTDKDGQISRLKDQLNQTTQEKQKADEAINKMSRELFLLSKEKDETQKRVQKLEKELESNSKQHKKTQDTLNQKLEELKKLKSQLDAANSTAKALSTQKDQVEKELSEVKGENTQNSSLVNQLTEKLRGLANTCNKLASEKAEIETSFTDLQRSSSIEVAGIKSKLEALTELNATLDAAKAKLNEELKSHKKRLQEGESLLQEATEKLKKENEVLQTQIAALESELTTAKDDNAKLQEELEKSTGLLEKTRTELSDKERKHNEQLSFKEKGFGDEKSKLEKKLNDLVGEHTGELASLKEQLEKSKSMKSSLEKELSTQKENHSSSQKTLAAKEKEINELKDALKSLETQIETQNQLKTKLEGDLGIMKKNHNDEKVLSEKTIEELKKNKQELEVELDDLALEYETKEHDFKKEITSLKEKVGSLEEEKKSLESTLEIISQNIEGKAKEYETLSKEFKSKQSDNDKVSKQLENALNDKAGLEKSMEEQQKKLDGLNVKLDDATQELKTLKIELQEKTSSLKSLEKKLEAQKSNHNGQVEGLEKEIKILQTNLKTKVQDFEKERSLLSDNSTSATKEYSEKVSRLEEKIQETEKVTSVKLAVLEKKKAKLEESISELESQVESLKSESSSKDNKIKDLNVHLEKILQEKKASEKALTDATNEGKRVTDLQSKITELEKEVDDLSTDATQKEKSLNDKAQKLEEITSELAAKNKDLKKLQSELDSQKVLSEKASSSSKETTEKLKKELIELKISKKEVSDKLEDLKKTSYSSEAIYKKEVDDMKEQLDESTKRISKLEEDVKKGEEDLSKATSTNEEKHMNTAEEIDTLKKENSSLKEAASGNKEMESLLKDANIETEKLRKELEELKAKTVPKSDLDDLVLVLDEMDEAKKRYKAKAKELGGDVSSDEESDSDEDDESDEE